MDVSIDRSIDGKDEMRWDEAIFVIVCNGNIQPWWC